MIAYFLKSILCLAILLLVYLLFLEKEKMHRFNRWYLLGSILFSCLVPLISFTVTAESLPVLQNDLFTAINEPVNTTSASSSVQQLPAFVAKAPSDYIIPGLYLLYGMITVVLLSRFVLNIYRLLTAAAKNKVVHYRGAKLVLLKENIASYSFLNYIFLNEKDYNEESIEAQVIIHELTHVREKHSWDVIFIELLQTIFWFNPLFIFYKKAIRLNHEYLADDAVIKTFENIPAYQHLLLEKIGFNTNPSFTSSFNYSITKKRFLMMTRSNNRISILLKKIAVLPLLAGGIILFSSREIIAQQKKEPAKTAVASQDKKQAQPDALWAQPGDMPIISASGVSEDQLKEYNRIVDETVTKEDNDVVTSSGHHVNMARATFKGTAEQRNQLFDIYKQMNAQQRHEARVGFHKRWNGPKKGVPTEAQLQKWKDPSNYGVWIDSKKVNNEVLNSYKASDFSYYSASSLAYTEKQKQHIMELYNLKTMYKVQLNLMTHKQFNKEASDALAQPEYNLFYHIIRDEKGNRDVEWRMMIKEL
ncbi:MAG: M56 family metallopeptidase [Sediminibacterium sp.]